MKYWNKAQAPITALTPIIALVVIVLMVAPAVPVAAQDQVTIPREQTFSWGANFLGPRAGVNPYNILTLGMGGYDWPFVYEPLAVMDPDGIWTPILAESWQWVDDYTFEITIRPEAYFRKGQPVTADDVKFSLDTLSDSTYSGILSTIGYSDLVESVDVVDEKTLHVNTTEDFGPRYPRVLSVLLPPTRILQKDQWSQLLEEYGSDISDYLNLDPDNMNGSGPYTLLSSTLASTIYVRVDDYWGNQIGMYYSPKYYQALWCGNSELVTRALEDGSVDYGETVGVTPEWLDERRQPIGWMWMLNPAAPTPGEGMAFEMADFVVALNYDREILREDWLRYAIAYAMDYTRIIQVEATAEAGAQSGPYYLPFYLPSAYYNSDIVDEYFETETVAGVSVIKYDPEKAIEILSEHCTGSVATGWTVSDGGPCDGQRIGPFTVLSWIDVVSIAAANEVIANSLTAIGIESTAEQLTYGQYDARSTSGSFDFDVRWAAHFIGPFPDPITNAYNGTFLLPATCWGGSKVDYKKYFNGEYSPLENTVDLVEDLITQLWYLEAGSDEFIAVVRQIQEIVIPQLPAIPIYQKIAPMLGSVRNWVNYPYVDDPLDWRTKAANDFAGTLMHVYSKYVDTVSATLSSNTVAPGEPATITVTLQNNGYYDQLYPVKVHNGPAAPGEYLTEPEKLVAHTAVNVLAGGTATATLEVTFDEAGTYTLTVDDWRYSQWDPGDPVELTLTVTAATTTTTTTTTTPPTTTTTTTTTTTPPPSEVWTWVAVGIGVVVVIAIVALVLMRKK